MKIRQDPGRRKSTLRLIVVPALISLVVTLWRLTGELLSWSESMFNPEPGGAGAIVGITWLAPVFGIYFALELLKQGKAPRSWKKTAGLALLGMIILFTGGFLQPDIYSRNWMAGLLFIWLAALVAAAMQFPAWRDLCTTLLAYGLAARTPVILIMLLAIAGSWGTHYDAVPPGFPEMGWFVKFLWLGFFPQLLLWVSFTLVTGVFFGTIVAAIKARKG
jgi:hypothetical protein